MEGCYSRPPAELLTSPFMALSTPSSSADGNGVVPVDVSPWCSPSRTRLYYTKVQLGSPPKDFYVQIDTGSDVLWVSCSSCSGCPSKTDLEIPLNSFNPRSSSSASAISCSDQRCTKGIQSSDATCSAQDNQCSYSFQYGDGSTTSGYYVSDSFHFDNVQGGGESQTANSSAAVVFGCSTAVSGQLTKTDRAVNGIFGFGQQSLSVISQLASQGITPKVFSHCLKGDDAGGGILVLGEIMEPNMIYTPLVPSQSHYNLNLESISVNGQELNIDPSVFATSSTGGTIIDSGTTLAYLAEKAYEPFVTAIDAAVSQSIQRVPAKDNQCYLVTSSVDNGFPQVTLNFEGNSSMVIGPRDYLLKQGSAGGVDVWCIGIAGIQGGLTILGDLVLKDKIIVYDLARQRIGWTNYDCSLSVNVSTTSNSGEIETVSAGQPIDGSSSPITLPDKSIIWIVAASIMYTLVLSNYMFP
ncbi:aspartic proteinase-like protein 2 isoform X2 [Punica granatum]|uniref:Aspartic proteinase-like protein 2 isoform X2 n=1 Tax=Punica granatum TaxID=22663 RepID=A0A6P8DZF2_PUNGR|nr:aspartic proteinase-like protein 2 isoform X2 [Punica granatum]